MKNKAAFVLWCIASTAAVVALLEFGAWLALPERPPVLIDDPILHHRWNPNTSFTHSEWIAANPEFPEPFVHYYNSESWIEEEEIQKAKPPGTFRIFYLGDSFTEGCVPMDQSVASIVEKRLGELDCNVRFEVINTGTSSYSPVLFYLLLKSKILDYTPDLVVVNVDLSDDFDDWKYRQSALWDTTGLPTAVPPEGVLRSADATLWERVRILLYRYSSIFNLLLEVRRVRTDQRASPELMEEQRARQLHRQGLYSRWATVRPEWDVLTTENADFSISMMRAFIRLAAKHDIRVLVTGVPHVRQFPTMPGEPASWSHAFYDRLAFAVREEGAVFFDSVAAVAPRFSYVPPDRFYYRDDIHLNPVGNRIWAEAQLDALRSSANKLLPECATS